MSDCTSFIDELVKNGSVGFDPLGSFEDDFEAQQPPEPWPGEQINAAYDESLPANQRIQSLFEGMAPRRNTLLGIIRFCETPQTTEALDAKIDELQQGNVSVFSSADLAKLMLRAGALQYVNAEGAPTEKTLATPDVVEVNGVEYYQAEQPEVTFWASTKEAIEYANADNPDDQLKDIFEEDAIYLPIYKEILEMSSTEEGASTKALAKALDNHELLKSPRFYSSFFVEKLANCNAVEWTDTWRITELGKKGLTWLDKQAN